MTTLKQLATQLQVSPVDLTGDAELARQLMNRDISGTAFYKDLVAELA